MVISETGCSASAPRSATISSGSSSAIEVETAVPSPDEDTGLDTDLRGAGAAFGECRDPRIHGIGRRSIKFLFLFREYQHQCRITMLKNYIILHFIKGWCMYRILVVDDEPALLELNRIYLTQSGEMQVETTTTPLQALDMLSKTPYDAIVADYEMPEMDGIALLKEVRKRGHFIPFIIFSGRGRRR